MRHYIHVLTHTSHSVRGNITEPCPLKFVHANNIGNTENHNFSRKIFLLSLLLKLDKSSIAIPLLGSIGLVK